MQNCSRVRALLRPCRDEYLSFVISVRAQTNRTVQIVPSTRPADCNQSLHRYCPPRPRAYSCKRRVPSQETQLLRPQTIRPSINQRVGSVATWIMYINSRCRQLARTRSKYWQDQIVLAFAVKYVDPRSNLSSLQRYPYSSVPASYLDDEMTVSLRM